MNRTIIDENYARHRHNENLRTRITAAGLVLGLGAIAAVGVPRAVELYHGTSPVNCEGTQAPIALKRDGLEVTIREHVILSPDTALEGVIKYVRSHNPTLDQQMRQFGETGLQPQLLELPVDCAPAQ